MGSKPGSRVEYKSPGDGGSRKGGNYAIMLNMAGKCPLRVNIALMKCLFRQFNARHRLPG
eukprot:4168924-Pleurochrysis_carterae.AAC.1